MRIQGSGVLQVNAKATARARRELLQALMGCAAVLWGGGPPLPAHTTSQLPSVIISGGFLLPPQQYASYTHTLSMSGIPAAFVADSTALNSSQSYDSSVSQVLAAIMDFGCRLDCPLVLAGHSRGGSVAVEAALAIAQRGGNVRTVVLLDPVDQPDRRAINATGKLKCPVIVLSTPYSGYSTYYQTKLENSCAPEGRNAAAFYSAACTPRMLLEIPSAGHLQLLDSRNDALFGCAVGRASDDEVHKVVNALLLAACTEPIPSNMINGELTWDKRIARRIANASQLELRISSDV